MLGTRIFTGAPTSRPRSGEHWIEHSARRPWWLRRAAAAAGLAAILLGAVVALRQPASPGPRPVVLLGRTFRNPAAGYAIDHPAAWTADVVQGGWGAVFSELPGDQPGEAWLDLAWVLKGVQVVVESMPASAVPGGDAAPLSPLEAAVRLDVPSSYASGTRELIVAGEPALGFTHRSGSRWEELVIACPPGRLLLVHVTSPAHRVQDVLPIWDAMLASLRRMAVSETSTALLPPEIRRNLGLE